MVESLFQDIIEADAATMALLTGGVYIFSELGKAGLAPSNSVCAAAFEVVNDMTQIKPCVVIRVRLNNPTFDRSDSDSQEIAYDGIVEFWLYQDSGYTTIDSVSGKLRSLLSARSFDGIGLVQPFSSLPNLVAPEFRDISLRRDDYRFRYVDRG